MFLYHYELLLLWMIFYLSSYYYCLSSLFDYWFPYGIHLYLWSTQQVTCVYLLYCRLQHHNDTIIKTQEDFFNKIYLSLYCMGSKRVTQGLYVRGSWRPNRNSNILTPLLWSSALRLSCSHDAQPEALGPTFQGDDFLYCILSTTSLDPNSIGGPEPLRPGVAFLTTSRL